MPSQESFQSPHDEILTDLKAMAVALIRLESASRSLLGLTETIQYRELSFQVGERFVVADVRPLAFLGLMEDARQGTREAVERLYDRIAPLLTCRHEWTLDDHSRMDGFAAISAAFHNATVRPHVCKLCTAYSIEGYLPEVGRSFERQIPKREVRLSGQ